ncbi:alpha/beta fold hydrolase [Pseudonocardia sp. NPDC049154]|uniref:alpha/beta fold hydrolase n=1 Tax=Pseudonocardia sp. NPDC049154 TaxID=3155501 RepID=UPI0033EEBCA3
MHGTSADHSRWAPVLPAFEQRYTVHAVDRRGRGGRGDSEDFAMEREFEDVAAVVDSLGEPVNLLGHSYGGLCALEAALVSRNVLSRGTDAAAERKRESACLSIGRRGRGRGAAGLSDRRDARTGARGHRHRDRPLRRRGPSVHRRSPLRHLRRALGVRVSACFADHGDEDAADRVGARSS